MQRVFRNPYSGFKGTVTIEVNNGKYSNYVCRDEMDNVQSNMYQHRYTHDHLEELITKSLRTGWWVEVIDPDLVVAEGL